jgi:predicted alpha/beta superfamily hydrolase
MTTGTRRAYTLFQTDAFDLDSAVLGRRYEISVALPLSYHATDRRYPVLVVLDANLAFAGTVETARVLALGGEAEELIVVGVGSPWAEGMEGFGRRRFYEFSPAERWDVDGPFAEVTKAAFAQAGVDPQVMGGAPKFLRLLTEEVLPVIGRDYRADLTSPGLFGDSAGGAFALYALLSGVSPFRKYICGSPATAQCNDALYRMEEHYAATHSDLDAAMFLAAGSEEMGSPFLEGGGIASGVCRFSGLFALRQYPNFRVTSHFFPDEGHVSVIPAIVSRGIRTLWDTGRRFGIPPKRVTSAADVG